MLTTLMREGVVVSVPFSRFGAYDLLADFPSGELLRIQVKSGRVRKGCIEFNCCGTDHGNGVSHYHGRADVFAVHVHETGQQYIVPVSESMGSRMFLRLSPTRNNQSAGVRWAADYHVDDWLERMLGPTAESTALTAGAATAR